MRKSGIAIALLAALLCVAPLYARRPKVGLVLSGGGAKGIAHIGVIQAFEENDIPIDYITGTSMGAIVGSLYAAGYTPDEMLELLASPGFADWSTGRIDRNDTYYFLSTPETPSFVSFNLGRDSTSITSVLPVSLINPIPMNMAFPEIYSKYTAVCEGDFDRLFVPFRCVTSDVYAKHKVVLSKGSLADAVRMSMSFPMVFEPIEMDGVPMYDGGIYDNFPVDVMVEEFNPDALVGVDVGSKNAPPGTRNPMDQLEQMIMQPDNYPFPYDKGVYIRIDLDEFGLLDFGKYREIYDIGYRRGLEMIDSVRTKVGTSVPAAQVRERRAGFRSRVRPVRISHVNVTGGSPAENSYLQSLFVIRDGETMSFDKARDAYYRAVSSGRLQNFVPTPVYHPDDSAFTFDYKAIVKENYAVGVGGYISSSTNSMLFFHTGYNTLSFKSVDANLDAWLGQSYLAGNATFRLLFNTRRPSALSLRVVGSKQKFHESEKLFYQIHEPDFVHQSEVFVQGFFTSGPTLRSRVDIGIGFGHLTDRYHSDVKIPDGMPHKDTGVFNLGQIRASWESNTLDTPVDPSAGTRLKAVAMGVTGRYHYRVEGLDEMCMNKNVSWLQADLSALHFVPVGRKVSLGLYGRTLLSTRRLLPTYMASIVAAEAIHPTPSTYNNFYSDLRANSFVTLGLEPVWKVSGMFEICGSFHGFMPLRKIKPAADGIGACYGRWFHDPEFFGELQARLKLPFGVVSAYGNYTSSADGWHFGISIGAFILAPRFLQ